MKTLGKWITGIVSLVAALVAGGVVKEHFRDIRSAQGERAALESTGATTWKPLASDPSVMVYEKSLVSTRLPNGDVEVRLFTYGNYVPADKGKRDNHPGISVMQELSIQCRARQYRTRLVAYELPDLQGAITEEARDFQAIASIAPMSPVERVADVYCSQAK